MYPGAGLDGYGKSRPQRDSIRGISVVEELNINTEHWWNDNDGKKKIEIRTASSN
jgi:hypothetical protein